MLVGMVDNWQSEGKNVTNKDDGPDGEPGEEFV